MNNIILITDSYKISHHHQYPPNTENIYSYFEARNNDSSKRFREIIFFGLQYFLKNYLEGQVVTKEKIDEAEEVFKLHFGQPVFNRAGWEYILNKHNGHLPVSIKCVPEGTVVPRGHVLMTIENTDPECFWLTNYLETLLVQCWYPSTVASQSRDIKKLLARFLEDSVDEPEKAGIDYRTHDFGFRGVSSVESAGLGGAAHLVNFKGTDTLAGIILARKYYGEPMAGFSIPAAEHSTITSWGQNREVDAYRNMLDQFPGMVAVVSDSYNLWYAIKEIWGNQLRDKVIEHGKNGGVLVVRPDSGYPPTVVCETIQALGEKFGLIKNKKGFYTLNNCVRVIQGDGINYDMVGDILNEMRARRLAGDNIAFGSGGALLQKLDRDSASFAFKCCSARVAGKEIDVFKTPVDDKGKASKRGRLKLVYENGQYITCQQHEAGEDLLAEVFRDGKITSLTNFSEVRERAKLVLDRGKPLLE